MAAALRGRPHPGCQVTVTIDAHTGLPQLDDWDNYDIGDGGGDPIADFATWLLAMYELSEAIGTKTPMARRASTMWQSFANTAFRTLTMGQQTVLAAHHPELVAFALTYTQLSEKDEDAGVEEELLIETRHTQQRRLRRGSRTVSAKRSTASRAR